ncbi:MAG: N-acetyl-1-D-myo-inositol-2-amino-2-deoxy-alpha-D-glucopyranoside deacetylase [Nocardioides sp.]
MRAIFFDEAAARAVAGRLVGDGYAATVARERFAGEDDDEDHPWAVLTDAPAPLVELLVDEYDGWPDADESPAEPVVPLELPSAPRRITRPDPGAGQHRTTLGPMTDAPAQRLLLVHAHPDDESIGQGATMARYAAEGRGVTLVTCTAGEMGEVLVPELAHLAAEQDGGLEHQRRVELEQAMKELGVTDHRFLGGFGRFRDSGMKWHEDGHAVAADETDERAFANADLTEAANLLVEVIREVRPQVLVTYDEFGGYGHPDHIQAHRVAMYAATLAAVPSHRRDLGEAWDVTKIYWGTMSESRMRAGLRALREAGDTTTFEGMDPDGQLPPFARADKDLAAEVDGGEHVEQKMAAMRAHATQITVDGPFFALSNNVGDSIWATEFYRIAKGVVGTVDDRGLETDLFAGL